MLPQLHQSPSNHLPRSQCTCRTHPPFIAQPTHQQEDNHKHPLHPTKELQQLQLTPHCQLETNCSGLQHHHRGPEVLRRTAFQQQMAEQPQVPNLGAQAAHSQRAALVHSSRFQPVSWTGWRTMMHSTLLHKAKGYSLIT